MGNLRRYGRGTCWILRYYWSTYRYSSVLKSKAKAALLNQLWMWIVGLVSTGDLKSEARTINLCHLALSEQKRQAFETGIWEFLLYLYGEA